MSFEQIMSIFVAVAPAVTAVVGVVTAVIKCLKSNENLHSDVKAALEGIKDEIVNTKEYTEVKSQLLLVHSENLELKKKINELLTKIDRIYRGEEDSQ